MNANTLFERAMGVVKRTTPTAAGGAIIYSRGDDICGLSATFGQSPLEVDDANGTRLEYTDRDFIVQAAKLILNGVLATPARGDRIQVINSDGSEGDLYEVLAPGGAQVYRRSDPEGTMIRIHGKRIDAA